MNHEPTDRIDPATATPEALFDAHRGLADRLARRYSFGASADDDLRQVAQIGLLLACRRFDPELGVFVRFATVTIVGELKKYLRSHGWGVRVPRSLQEDTVTVAAAKDRLTARFGRAPTVEEVADHAGLTTERVVEALRARMARFTSSSDSMGVDERDPVSTAEAAIVAHALGSLSDHDRRLIELRFRDGLTQAEIGHLIGLSQPQTSRHLAAAVAALRERLEEHDVDD